MPGGNRRAVFPVVLSLPYPAFAPMKSDIRFASCATGVRRRQLDGGSMRTSPVSARRATTLAALSCALPRFGAARRARGRRGDGDRHGDGADEGRDGRIPQEARRLHQGLRRLRQDRRALLARRHRQALAPPHQGGQQHAPFRRRLRDDAAAGLQRAGEAGEPAAARQEAQRHPRRDGLPRQCAGRVRLRPRGAGRRGHLQARLRQGRRRRRPHQGGGRQDLRL